jgi:toxin-antitoxin system PIN domain toxin
VILLDANLLIYAVDRDSPKHAPARRWLEEALSGAESVGIPWIVALAFIRITTHPSVMRRPLSAETAIGYVDSWLAQPFAKLVGPGDNHWQILRNLLLASGSAGNLTSDAHVAALAIEHGATVASADHDFRRFAGVTHLDPLTA